MAFQLPDSVMQSPHIAVRELMEQVKLRQSGALVDSMERMGLHYTLNYGVSLSQLKDIVSNYTPDNALAFLLFQYDIREAKLLASMLFKAEELSEEQLLGIADKLNTIELIEQYARNVFCKSANSQGVISKIFMQEGYLRALGIATIAWGLQNKTIKAEDAFTYLMKVKEIMPIEKSVLKLLLQKLGASSPANFKKVELLAISYKESEFEINKEVGEDFIWLNT